MLFNTIKEDRMQYLGKNSTAFSVLGLVVSEIQRSNLSTDIPDSIVVKTIKKLLEGINDSLSNAAQYGTAEDKIQKLEQEKLILTKYVPSQLSEQELMNVMLKAIEEVPERKTNKGAMFSYLKQNYESLYDGKQANILFGKL